MRVAGLTKVKDALSRYVEYVRHGGRVRILVRGVPVADLVPVEAGERARAAEPPHLVELERRGLLRRGKGSIPRELLAPGPRPRGKPLSRLVIEERRRR